MTDNRRGSRSRRGHAHPAPIYRWLLPLMAGLLLLFGCVVGLSYAQAADVWTDISDAQWVTIYGITAQAAGTVADGYPDVTFRPYADVTRGQFAKMSVRGLGVETKNSSTPTFLDVPSTHLFYLYVEGGAAAGIIGGFPDDTFHPDQPIERQQSNAILGRYLAAAEIGARGGIKGDVLTYPSLEAWYRVEGAFYLPQFDDESAIAEVHRPATAYLIFRNVVHGANGKLTPTALLSRAQAVTLVLRTVQAAAEVTTPPPPPTVLATNPTGPANERQPLITGQTIVDGRIAIYDTFASATTELVQGAADSSGHFSIRVPALLEGSHSFTAKVKDASGVISAASAPVSYRLDLTDPTGEITAPVAGTGVASRKPIFTVNASDESAGLKDVRFEYRATGSSEGFVWVSIDTAASAGEYQAAWGDRSLPDGAYEFRAVLTDLAGNNTLLGPMDVVVDLMPPTVELQAPSASGPFYSHSRTPVFVAAAVDEPAASGVASSGVARVDFLCSLGAALPPDPADWTATDFTLLSSNVGPGYSAAWGTTSLADGRYVFAVQSVDGAGNASSLDTQEVVIDNASPALSITAPLASATLRAGTPFVINWVAEDTYFGIDAIKIEYSSDGGFTWPTVIVAATANDGSFSWTTPAADVAQAKIRVTATDGIGYATEVVSGPFSIDNTPPDSPTDVTAVDNDNVQPGIDGRDFTIAWTPSASAETVKQLVYILPDGTTLQPYAAAHTPVAVFTNNTTAFWTGTSAVAADSAGTPFGSELGYDVWVMAEDAAGNRSPSAPTLWPAETPAAPTVVSAGDPDSAHAGIDGRDFQVSWTKSISPHVLTHRIYILPSATALKLSGPGAHVPVASSTDDSVPWVGGDTILNDSAGAPLAAVSYIVYVVATDDDGRSSWNSASMTPVAP